MDKQVARLDCRETEGEHRVRKVVEGDEEHPERHHHFDMNELIKCCMVNNAIDGMLMEKHAGLGYNGNRKRDVMNGPCSCGGWH